MAPDRPRGRPAASLPAQTARQTRAQQRRQDRRDRLRHKHPAVLRRRQTVVSGTRQDRADCGKGDERDPLNDRRRVDSGDFLALRHGRGEVTSTVSSR